VRHGAHDGSGRWRLAAVAFGAALAACALPPLGDPAASPTISTNRPSFSDSASLVPNGRVQVESGYTFTADRRDGAATRRHAAPETLVRFGALERLEAQLLWGGQVRQEVDDGASTSGASDLGFGLRTPIAGQQGWRPQLALGAIATVGTGDDGFTTGAHASATGKLLWAYAFDSGVGLGGNLIAGYPHDGTERFLQFAASQWATVALDARWTAYGEVFAVAPKDAGGGTNLSLAGGLLFLVSRTVQLDVRSGFGLTDDADDVFAGCGIGVLF
jgi:hypothetical protein